MRQADCLQLGRKMEKFREKKEPTYQKTLNFVEKPFLELKIKNGFTSIQKMADSGIRTRHLWLPKPGDAHTFVLIKVQTALQ